MKLRLKKKDAALVLKLLMDTHLSPTLSEDDRARASRLAAQIDERYPELVTGAYR